MTEASNNIKYHLYQRAILQLEKAVQMPYSEFIRDAVIQRFVFCYDLAWKSLRIYLATLGITTQSPKETIRAAFSQGVITDADGWTTLQMNRNLTTHTYNEHLANEVYEFIKTQGLSLFKSLDHMLKDKM